MTYTCGIRASIMLLFFILMLYPVQAQNLMNTTSWTLGSGSVTGYSANGSLTENWRVLGEDHLGRETILWEARNDAASNADGGWNSSYFPIDNLKTYRFTVWIKKTNSNDGRTYFGCYRNNGILNLSGSININPYFWVGDLPQLDRWYLLVGFVHNKNYSPSGSYGVTGAIYDGVTGLQVQGVTVKDFKFSSTATIVRHRTFLYYDTNINDRQYFMKPRLEEINGQEPSILELLEVNPNSTIGFEYDTAGNQKLRLYCDQGNCFRNSDKNITSRSVDSTKVISQSIEDIVFQEEELGFEDHISSNINLYPNPTSNILNVQSLTPFQGIVHIMNTNGQIIKSISGLEGLNDATIDVSDLAKGVYVLHIHFENATESSQKFIKN